MFIIFFFLSFILIQSNKSDVNIKTKAEFIITLTWSSLDSKNQDDIDTYVQDPLGNIIYYKNKTSGLVHLDRDDRGSVDDIFVLEDGTVCSYDYNQEITTIRGFIPGEWVINIHMFAKRDRMPTNVEVKVEKLNPSMRIIAYKKYVMVIDREEITVVRFTMSSTGKISNKNTLSKILTSKVAMVGGM